MGRTVVIVSGGYGGAAAAKALDQDADVVLIEPWDAFVQNAVAPRPGSTGLAEYKGSDLFTGRFAELFGVAHPVPAT
jgi:NADH dehydrogenase FAD-containing subunit